VKDWSGNTTSIYATHGASNHSEGERADNDYYATDPEAVEKLLENEKFYTYIWEPACGGGHISDVLKYYNYTVKSSDIVDRGYKGTQIIDFLAVTKDEARQGIPHDIITNPPYKYAKEFVEKALDVSMNGAKVAMFLKLTFLEGSKRKELFDRYPPKKIYVFRNRIDCWKNGIKPEKPSKAVCYAWFVWEKGFEGNPQIKWI
jgi:hypothetical protein